MVELWRKAARTGHLRTVKRLFAKVGRPKDTLSLSAHCGHLQVVQWLLQKGGADAMNRLTLQKAIENGRIHVVQWLWLTQTGVVDVMIYPAVSNGHLDVAQWLVAKGASLDTCGASGASPLHIAASKGYFEIVK